MPPTSNIRKTSAANGSTVPHINDLRTAPRRTTSGRAVRQTTTRPTNYYARPFGTTGANNAEAEMEDNGVPQAFFPALTYFTDAITALPKEVMRQFTLMKEVEAKIHAPNERLGELVDELMEYPVPPRNILGGQGDGAEVEVPVGGQGAGMLGLHLGFPSTADNSVVGSTTASLINGMAPNGANTNLLSAQNSVPGSVNGEEVAAAQLSVGGEGDIIQRQKFHELRMLTPKLLVDLDEKNVVLAEANRILAQQSSRIDSVLPHLHDELSEEARLGSMRHWAYSDNRVQRKQLTGANAAANRRDVAATNSLAAAASAIHESDIAQARRDAVREAQQEKHHVGGKGRRKEHVDSDFDDKPAKKAQAKIAKSKIVAAGGQAGMSAPGWGISGVDREPVKRRKLDKGLAAGVPAMERSISTKGASKAMKDTPRSTPTAETVGKKVKAMKPAPAPLKRKGISVQASPALGASSPLHSSFVVAGGENARPQSSRLRQNSTATNLRHERLANANEDGDRPTSAPAVKANGERKRKAAEEANERNDATKTTEGRDGQNHEDADNIDPEHPTLASRSHSHSGKAGRGSLTGTPLQSSFPTDGTVPSMLWTRSTRSQRGNPNGEDESSAEPSQSRAAFRMHKRVSSHLVKQLAPFNKSPDIDRDHGDEMDEDPENLPGGGLGDAERISSPRRRRPSSRRNTVTQIAASSPPQASDRFMDADGDTTIDLDSQAVSDIEADEPEEPSPADPEPRSITPLPPSPPPPQQNLPSPTASSIDVDEEEEEEGSGDPDDPNEPKYCYCDRGSYGEMIACDNEQCPREWFHLGCTGLAEPPEEEVKWFCRVCAPIFLPRERERERGGKGGRGRGRGKGRVE